MSKLIFINLPVSDLDRSAAFYQAIGATKNAMFSDDTAACMVFSETIHVMLLTHDKFCQFTPKAIASEETTEVLFCMSAESRAEVDETATRAGNAGGRADPSPAHEHGFMYGRSFEDPDGHGWQLMWMDMQAAAVALAKSPETADA